MDLRTELSSHTSGDKDATCESDANRQLHLYYLLSVHGSPAVLYFTQTLQGCMSKIMKCFEIELPDFLCTV